MPTFKYKLRSKLPPSLRAKQTKPNQTKPNQTKPNQTRLSIASYGKPGLLRFARNDAEL